MLEEVKINRKTNNIYRNFCCFNCMGFIFDHIIDNHEEMKNMLNYIKDLFFPKKRKYEVFDEETSKIKTVTIKMSRNVLDNLNKFHGVEEDEAFKDASKMIFEREFKDI